LSLSKFRFVLIQPNVYGGFVFDTTFAMLLIMLYVVMIASIITHHNLSSSSQLCFLAILVRCILTFGTDNVLVLYLAYEASLIPIIYIICKWGSYPDRALRRILLLAYTAVCSVPFIFVLREIWGGNLT